MKFRNRYNYWSCSKFANWLRSKAGLTNPIALSMEDWDLHKKECKEKAPFIYWLTNTVFNKAQKIAMYPSDVLYTINCYRSNVKGNSHVLDGV